MVCERMRSKLCLGLVFAALLGIARPAQAFCGFYVGGAGAKLFNNATLVVLMRDGTRTVLSMQNNYQGPPSNFAMVVPVPIVLQKENVKTLPREVFERIDTLAAPRLVEYWEMDPCFIPPPVKYAPRGRASGAMADEGAAGGRWSGVKVEAQFKVGEYEIVILSADDATGLDHWIRDHGYNIPDGAEPVLRPYVEQGMKFFVAKVDVAKVTMKDGQAMLSPLRFHYDTDHFALPVRLGLLNSSGTQDLLVHILARNQRYEVANYDNVTIPTNFDVSPATAKRFGEFYAALFDEVTKKNPRAVITEYAWQATSCDPCPGPPLDEADFMTLGGDVAPSVQLELKGADESQGRGWGGGVANDFVVTRLHARYGKDVLGEDLVFRQAPSIVGGREITDDAGKIERSAQPDSYNNFQGRYIVRHAWPGPIACAHPVRGRWGGPPNGAADKGPLAARDLAFAPRGKTSLGTFVSFPVTDLVMKSEGKSMGLAASIGTMPVAQAVPAPVGSAAAPVPSAAVAPTQPPTGTAPKAGGCAGCSMPRGDRHGAALLLSLLAAACARRRAFRSSCPGRRS
jgi:hypothetical protein